MGIWKRIKRGGLWERIASLLISDTDKDIYEELEETLIQADVGVSATLDIIDELKNQQSEKNLKGTDLLTAFREILLGILPVATIHFKDNALNILLIVGVNGSGKTTTAAKLGFYFKQQNYSPLLVAADTYRAAGIEQLSLWAQKLQLPVIAPEAGADPGAVAFDGREAALARENNILIVDTAGRLHTQKNLMEELRKVKKVLSKDEHNLHTILVLDAISGQNGLEQGRIFHKYLNVDGLIMTKLDGTARGGILFAIARELKIPVFMAGLGEKPEDLKPFNSQLFVDSLLEFSEKTT